jgi:NifB/MoaA-like Fe-S oxidoreductase
VVVCPGLNDGEVLDDTLAGVLDQYPELASLCVVPLGVSRYNTEARMRPHTRDEARAVLDAVEDWQDIYLRTLGHRLAFAADEYYLIAERPFPAAATYEGFPMHEDGIGMARTFELEFRGEASEATGPQAGFFASVDGAPAEGYRAPRLAVATRSEYRATRRAAPEDAAVAPDGAGRVVLRPRAGAPVAVLTGTYGAAIVGPLVASLGRDDVRVLPVANEFFGGNTAVTGLMVGADLARVLAGEPEGHRYLLPDVCLSQGRFLDGTTPAELPRPVEIIPTDGLALRRALEPGWRPTAAAAASPDTVAVATGAPHG